MSIPKSIFTRHLSWYVPFSSHIPFFSSTDALSDRGVRCFYDNHQLVQSANLIFLCVLPSHLADVVEEIRGSISATSTVYSFLSSVPLSKLRYCLGFPAVVKADLSWSAEDSGLDWDCTEDVCTVLENQVQVEMTCPLNLLENCKFLTPPPLCSLIHSFFLLLPFKLPVTDVC